MIDGDSLAFEEYLPICQHLTQDGIMQYTGLQDKNGKEIYEGDILKQTYHAVTGSYDDQISFDGYHIGAVVITASQGVCMKKPLCYSEETDETTVSNQYKKVAGYRCEVIGNIYENKELLQVA
ncbi:YopX family protein [Paenibacillus farraposensis]|uniref:YopX family protein n=2 Tax=Paenibacillus farraposensis TaxID=2807095 RepID=A0ABW4DC49_9BACL